MRTLSRVGRRMMRCIAMLALALASLGAATAGAAEVVQVAGSVTYVSTDVVEVAGRRGLIVPTTAITSDGREVSLAAIQVGMPAELEIDASGRALELRVKGAVE
jgi:hypothetical protein